MSEVLPNEVRLRKRSQTMANVKEHAYGRLQEELSKAQEVKKDFVICGDVYNILIHDKKRLLVWFQIAEVY